MLNSVLHSWVHLIICGKKNNFFIKCKKKKLNISFKAYNRKKTKQTQHQLNFYFKNITAASRWSFKMNTRDLPVLVLILPLFLLVKIVHLFISMAPALKMLSYLSVRLLLTSDVMGLLSDSTYACVGIRQLLYTFESHGRGTLPNWFSWKDTRNPQMALKENVHQSASSDLLVKLKYPSAVAP